MGGSLKRRDFIRSLSLAGASLAVADAAYFSFPITIAGFSSLSLTNIINQPKIAG
jgi:hypothetical protein